MEELIKITSIKQLKTFILMPSNAFDFIEKVLEYGGDIYFVPSQGIIRFENSNKPITYARIKY